MKPWHYTKFLTANLTVGEHGLRTANTYTNIEHPELLPTEFPQSYYEENYPRHESKLDLSRAEFILCKACGSRLQMSRHTHRTNPRLNQKYSTYHPQALQYCECKSLALLVDHRGTPRIYGTDDWELIIQPLGYERRFKALELPTEYIPKGLLEGFKRPRLVEALASSIPLKASGIILMDTKESAQLSFLVTPSAPHRYHNRYMEHFRRYAYTYRIIIATTHVIYLPSGHYMSTAKLKPLLDQCLPQGDKTLRQLLRRPLEDTNSTLEYLNELISKTYGLPLVPLEYYPLQTIGYLHIITSDTQNWEFTYHQGKWYAGATVLSHLQKLKGTILNVIKHLSFLRGDLKNLQLYTKDALNPSDLLIPPLKSYVTSRRLNPLFNPRA